MKRGVGVEVGVHRYCCCCWRVVAGSWLREDRGDRAGVAYYYSFPMLIHAPLAEWEIVDMVPICVSLCLKFLCIV